MNSAPESLGKSQQDGSRQAIRFAAFNALSFQIVLGAPMILYAKGLGASAAMVGLITGLLPLLVILQIPAARHVARFGYKRFVLAGWTVRTAFILAIAVVPILGTLFTDTLKLGLIISLLFLFNAVRGISSCAWLPWISSIIPNTKRGHFLLREAAVINFASILCVILAALVLGGDPEPWRFSVLFIVSAVAGFVSLLALNLIPEESDASLLQDSVTPVPVRDMLRLLPFRRLLVFNFTWALASGGVLAFAISFLKSEGGLPDDRILFLNAAVFLGGLGNLILLQRVVDTLGSRSILIGAASLWVVLMGLWTALAGKMLPLHWAVIFPLMLLLGFGVSMVNLANVRLAMTVIPERGRSHYFVVFSVVGNVILGIAPIAWGVVIDQCTSIHVAWHAFEINRYTIAFGGMGVTFIAFLISAWRLVEPESIVLETMLKEILTRSRMRHWLRLWPRG